MIQSFWTNLKIELIIRKSRISTYVYFLVLAVVSVLVVLSAGGGLKGLTISFGASAKAFVNGPYSIHMVLTILSLVGLLIIGPIFGQTVCKDYEAKFDQIIFATPTQRIGFYLGRFAGATLVSILIFAGTGIGFFLATLLPGLQASLFTKNQLMFYLTPYLTLILPNILILGSLFFAVAAFTRRMGTVYILGIILLLGYLFGITYTNKIDQKVVRALIDPFGLIASTINSEYWSVFEQNTRLITLDSYFLLNRLVWGGFALLALALGLYFTQKTWTRKSKAAKDEATVPTPAAQSGFVPVALNFTAAVRLRLLWRQLNFEARSAFKNIYFLSLSFAGVAFMLASSDTAGSLWGTPTYPVTYNILTMTVGSFRFFLTAILIFYTGELIWRERQHRLNQILDALPQPTWVPLVAKFLGMQAIILGLLAIAALTGMVIQLAQGYTNFELSQVFRTILLVFYPRFLIMGSFFLFIHVMIDSKYIGHKVCTVYALALIFLPQLGIEQDLYLPGSLPSRVPYSDMNGYGPFMPRVHAYQLYWSLGATVLLILCYLFWPYGTDSVMSLRRKLAAERYTRPLKQLTLLLVIAFLGQGSYIYYNTVVLNKFKSEKEKQRLAVAYEHDYKVAWDRKETLQMIGVVVKADITPEERRLQLDVDYKLLNKTQEPVTEMLLHVPLKPEEYSLSFDRPVALIKQDRDHSLLIYRFQEPVGPGAQVHMRYVLDHKPQGFPETGEETLVAANGTFFDSNDFYPSIGYSPDRELAQDKEREKYGLKPKPRMNPITDTQARRFGYVSKYATWIDFEATVSTSADQIAIAPGYLQKEWIEGNRRYFHYKMDSKILNFFSIQSARYEVKRDRWNDVAIEVYYHKGHEYNLDAMIAASKAGLDYFTKNFGPYQFRQFRILEFPRYRTFAQSFPNTIPFSEQIGFIAKVDPKSPDDLNYPYYVTAHELAHQWWAHQVIGADVQGSTMLVETMAQYSAVMVMEKAFGREKVERLLRHEGNNYLLGRAAESKREWPLALNEDQGYIHYRKGMQVMYALKEIVGEDVLNAAIFKFAEKVRFQEAPFATAPEFVDSLKASLDPKFTPLLDELFNKIVLFDNRIQAHTVTEGKDGSLTIDLEVLGRKFESDGLGEEKDQEFAQEMEFGGRLADGTMLPVERHVVKTGLNKIQLHPNKKPKSIYLDPMGMWIDTNREDNKLAL